MRGRMMSRSQRRVAGKSSGRTIAATSTAVACKMALERGLISVDDKVVLFNTATGLKYPMPEVTSYIDKRSKIDYRRFS